MSVITFSSWAQDDMSKYVISTDLKYDWMVFDEGEDSFVPYRNTVHKSVKAHSLVLNANSNKNYLLLIKCTVPGQHLFINGSLSRELPVDKIVELPISSLTKNGEDWFYITIFGSSSIASKNVFIAYKRDALNSLIQVAKKDVLQMNRKKVNPSRTVTVFSSILMLFLLAFTSGAYPRAFTKFVDFFGVFSAKLRETAMLVNKPYSRTNMTFLLFLAITTGYICWCFYDLGADVLLSSNYLLNGTQFWILVINFFMLSLVCYVFYFAKMLYIRIVGSIFGLGKIVDLHYFKLIQISLSLFLPFALLLTIFLFSGYDYLINAQSFFFWASTIFYLVRMVAILFALNTNGQIQLHYLITYLCVVELIPLALGLRFVL